MPRYRREDEREHPPYVRARERKRERELGEGNTDRSAFRRTKRELINLLSTADVSPHQMTGRIEWLQILIHLASRFLFLSFFFFFLSFFFFFLNGTHRSSDSSWTCRVIHICSCVANMRAVNSVYVNAPVPSQHTDCGLNVYWCNM